MMSVLALLASVVAVSAQSCTPNYGGNSANQELTAPALFQVTMDIQVSEGGTAPIVIEVNRTWSPVGADHFYTLLRDGYFNCAAFYKVTSSYAQTGYAATSDATSKWGAFIADDDVTVPRLSNSQYTVSFVPDDGFGTQSTHFMIHLADNSYLDSSNFYPFAQVVEGFSSLATLSTETFVLSNNEKTLYEEGGNEWLFSTYSEDDVTLISSVSVPSTSGSGSQDRSGSWAFGTIMVLLSSAACVYGGLYIYRFVRKQQGYDTMSSDSMSGSADRIITLNGRDV